MSDFYGICLLNRKPYRDKHGNVRVRTACDKNCKHETRYPYPGLRHQCTLRAQPVGEVLWAKNK